MIYCLACSCGGVDSLMRRILKNANYPKWLTEPIYKGKEKVIAMIDKPELQEKVELRALLSHVKGASSFAIILGIKNGKTIWADAGRGDVQSVMDAQIIVEQFAE